MSAIPKKKLCWNCEGNVSHNIDNCPYCGVYLHAAEEESEDLWNPPYRLVSSNAKEEELLNPLYQSDSERDGQEDGQSSDFKEASNETDDQQEIGTSFGALMQDMKRDMLPLFLLVAGSMFFVFGIMLLLFSEDGLLTLRWNASLWPFFLGGSTALFFFGYRRLGE